MLAHFEKGDILLLQNEVNMLDYIIDSAYEKGLMIILNPSPYNSALDTCDFNKISMFLLNEIEGAQVTGEEDTDKILAKLEICRQGIFKVKAVDTTAAGDTFTGYFISSIIEGMSVPAGLELAARASAIAVSREGATASIPLKEEVLNTEL